jgi:alpha-D-ribose 1-methylphosphonate 5-triphosphate synthase subunit PhnG
MESADYILCECDLQALEQFVEGLESHYAVEIAKQPSLGTVMLKTEDSVEEQPFYLGEALTTECMLVVNGQTGFGICLGDEPVRSYCIAFVDAVLSLGGEGLPEVLAFLEQQKTLIAEQLRVEYNQIQKTKVDFKLMEQD